MLKRVHQHITPIQHKVSRLISIWCKPRPPPLRCQNGTKRVPSSPLPPYVPRREKPGREEEKASCSRRPTTAKVHQHPLYPGTRTENKSVEAEQTSGLQKHQRYGDPSARPTGQTPEHQAGSHPCIRTSISSPPFISRGIHCTDKRTKCCKHSL